MYCPNCGKEAEGKFCPYCGQLIQAFVSESTNSPGIAPPNNSPKEGTAMKTMRMVIGIICCILFVLVAFQSCAVGVGNSLAESGEAGGSAGIVLAFCMLIAGILGIAAKKSTGAIVTAICFFILGGFIGKINAGSYTDLNIWSVISLIFAGLFAGLFAISIFVEKRNTR